MVLQYALSIAIAYLLGAIPTGYLVVRWNRNADILRLGSGRTGSTNVLRVLGWKAAGLVFAGDLAKGAAAVLAARFVTGGDPVVETIAGLVVVLGHTYSVFIGFKGGRGVACGVAALFVLVPLAGLIAAGIAFATMGITRYASLGSILGAASAPVTVGILMFTQGEPLARLVYALAAASFVVVTHKDNIGRLLSGTERRLGERVEF